MAMFGNPNAWMRGLPPSIAQDYMRDPRLLQGQSAFESGSSMAPAATPLAGLARALQGVAGGYMMRQARDDARGRADAYQKTLAEALGGVKSPPMMEDAPETGGITGEDRIARMARILAGNPDTADLGFKLQMQDVLSDVDYRRKVGREPPKTREIKRNGKVVTQQWNPTTRTYEEIATSPQFKPENTGGGPFEGKAMDAQAMNILLNEAADTSSDVYRAAYNHMAQPKASLDPTTGQIVVVRPDMSAYRPPTQQGVPQTSQTPAPSAAKPPVESTPLPGGGGSIDRIDSGGGKLTEGQGNAALFADRAKIANETLNKVEMAGTSLKGRALENVPGGVGNYMQSAEYQQFEQARRDFVNAILRKESGAVINPEEFVNAEKQYFPVPGDTPQVIEQKRKNRETAIKGLSRAAGPVYNRPAPAESGGIKFLGFE